MKSNTENENTTILVKNLGDGKIIGVSVGGDNPIADVTDNGDGSYSITVKRGGNLAISVEYEDPEEQRSEEDQKSEENQKSEEDQRSGEDNKSGTDTETETQPGTDIYNASEAVVVTMFRNTETAGSEMPLFTFDDDGDETDPGKNC